MADGSRVLAVPFVDVCRMSYCTMHRGPSEYPWRHACKAQHSHISRQANGTSRLTMKGSYSSPLSPQAFLSRERGVSGLYSGKTSGCVCVGVLD